MGSRCKWIDQAGRLFQGVLIAKHEAVGVEELLVVFVVIFMTFSFRTLK